MKIGNYEIKTDQGEPVCRDPANGHALSQQAITNILLVEIAEVLRDIQARGVGQQRDR